MGQQPFTPPTTYLHQSHKSLFFGRIPHKKWRHFFTWLRFAGPPSPHDQRTPTSVSEALASDTPPLDSSRDQPPYPSIHLRINFHPAILEDFHRKSKGISPSISLWDSPEDHNRTKFHFYLFVFICSFVLFVYHPDHQVKVQTKPEITFSWSFISFQATVRVKV